MHVVSWALIVSLILVPPLGNKRVAPRYDGPTACLPNREPIAPLPPTPQHDLVVNQLGASTFAERIQALRTIRSADFYSYFSACKKGLSSKDAEIRTQCELLLNEYCKKDIENISISIWCLPNDLRFVGDKDIAKIYYEEAYRSSGFQGNIWYENPYVACLATQFYLTDLLFEGATKLYVVDLVREMKFYAKFYDNFDDGKETNYAPMPMLFGMGPPVRVVPPGRLVK